jgi:hypothetical protein
MMKAVRGTRETARCVGPWRRVRGLAVVAAAAVAAAAARGGGSSCPSSQKREAEERGSWKIDPRRRVAAEGEE